MNTLHDSPYLMNSFLEEFTEIVLQKGGSLRELCDSIDFSVEAVRQRHKLIPFDKFIALLEEAASQFSYPEIALELAKRQAADTLGPVYLLLEECETFDKALDKILAYFDVLTSGFYIEPIVNGDLIELVFHVNLPRLVDKQQFQNYLLASCVSIIRNIMDEKYPIRGCYFTRTEEDPDLQRRHCEYFGCPVAFGAENIRLVFSSDILRSRVKITPSKTRQLMLGEEADLRKRLESILPLYLASGDARLSTIAKAMNYSTGTFRRRLRQSSISFGDTLEATRFSYANQLLESTHYKLSEISALLGYRNQSAFTRSYIRWCGITPSQYRQSLS